MHLCRVRTDEIIIDQKVLIFLLFKIKLIWGNDSHTYHVCHLKFNELRGFINDASKFFI